jgi:autotransporter translocation and assembly factor TamB
MRQLRTIARIAAKVAAVAVALAVVLPLLILAFLRTPPGHAVLRRIVVAQARKSVPGLSVGELGGGLLGDLSLREVDVRDESGAPAVHVDRLTVRYALSPLLRREVVVRDLQAHGLRVAARPDARGGTNLQHLTAPAAAPPAPAAPRGRPWTIVVERVLVDGASGTFEPESGDTRRLLGLHVEGRLRLAGDDVAVFVRELSARAETRERALELSVKDARFALAARSVEAAIGRATVGGLLPDDEVVSISARASGPRARVEAHLDVSASAAGHVALEGTVALPRGPGGALRLGTYDLTAAAELDATALAPRAPPGRIAASLRARGDGVPLEPGARAEVDLRLLPTAMAGLRVESAHVRATSRGRKLVADVAARVHGRRGEVSGRGQIALHAEGTLDALVVRAEGDLANLAVGDVRIGHATLALDAHGTAAAPSGTMSLVASRVVAGRDVPVIERANVDLSGDRGRLRLLASARGPRLRAAVGAAGVVTAKSADVTISQLALDVTTRTFRQQLALEQPARVRVRAGEGVTLERTVVTGAGARFTGTAELEGELHARPPRRGPLARVALRLTKASTGGLPSVDADLTATITGARAVVHLAAEVPSARARLELAADLPVVVPRHGLPKLAPRGPVEVRLESDRVALQAIPPLQRAIARSGITGGTMSIELEASGDISRPEAHADLELRDVAYRNLAGLGRDSRLKTVPGLGGSLKIDAKGGSLAADASLLVRDARVLTAHATVPVELGRVLAGERPRRLPLRANVEIPELRLASLTDFTDLLKGVDGRLHGRIELGGTLERPSGTADLAIDGAEVDKLTFKEVKLHADADDGQHGTDGKVAGKLAVVETTGGRLDGSFTLERAANARLAAQVTAKDLDVRFARLFLSNVREIAGLAQLSVTAKGSPSAPQVSGSLTLDKGRLGIVGQPTFRDLRLAVALEPGRISLNQLEMTSGDGRLQGKGWLTLGGARGMTPRRAVLQVHAHRFLVAVKGASGARVDGDLAFDAALEADVLAGKVEVPNANVWLAKTPSPTGGSLQKVGPHNDVQFVDATAVAAAARDAEQKQRAAHAALRLALNAKASPVYVRGKDMDLEVHSDVQIGTVESGPHRGALTLGGAIHIPRGRLNLQGQRFDVEHGDVTFDGTWDINPALDIRLTRQFSEARVVIELRGTPRSPQLRMSSEPPIYDQTQIVSLLLTGTPGGQPASGGKGVDPTSAVATAVLGRLADQVAPELGLDVMRVEKQDVKTAEGTATGVTNTRVEVGKYISQRVYLSYAHVFGAPSTANQNEAHVEYRVSRRWVLETIFGDAGQGGIDALWTHRF